MFKDLEKLPSDPIFGVVSKFNRDSNPEKINLSVGVYTDEEGAPFVFPSIQNAAEKLETSNFNYLPIQGNNKFLEHTMELFLGASALNVGVCASQQTCGGTHACKLFSDLVLRNSGKVEFLVGAPCWDNYYQIFDSHKIVKVEHLNEGGEVNFDAYEKALRDLEDGSVFVLQGGETHNPTGKNLSISQIKKLFPLILKKNVYVFVDYAYFGFGNGFDEDGKFLEFLDENLEEFALAVSYSKNASLYRHRTGALFVKTKNGTEKDNVESNLQNLIRGSVSNMPSFGSELMVGIFENDFEKWSAEVDAARKSIEKRRKALVEMLPEEFSHLKECSGMFGISGLNPKQVLSLQKEHSIYMPDNGRINFAGIKLKDIEHIADAISRLKS